MYTEVKLQVNTVQLAAVTDKLDPVCVNTKFLTEAVGRLITSLLDVFKQFALNYRNTVQVYVVLTFC